MHSRSGQVGLEIKPRFSPIPKPPERRLFKGNGDGLCAGLSLLPTTSLLPCDSLSDFQCANCRESPYQYGPWKLCVVFEACLFDREFLGGRLDVSFDVGCTGNDRVFALTSSGPPESEQFPGKWITC